MGQEAKKTKSIWRFPTQDGFYNEPNPGELKAN
jgi:hypothetical protein